VRRLLVVLVGPVTRAQLEDAVGDDDPETAVYVVAPSRVGPLEWLATDERRARGEAAARVLEAEWLLADAAEAGGEAGEADPVVAVGDALEHFPAQEIVLAGDGRVDGVLLDALRSFGLPVRTSGVVLVPAGASARVHEFGRSLRSGRSSATPFVAFFAANLGLLGLALLGSLLVALAVWLVSVL
jgi:hypothetical protein